MAQQTQDGRTLDAFEEPRRSAIAGMPKWPVFEASLIAEIDLEGARWAEITALTEMLNAPERLAPGYFSDPDWSVKDLIAHFGMWFEEARTRLIDIAAGAYDPQELAVDLRNAMALAALKDEPWEVVWTQAKGARIWMLQAWFGYREPSDAAIQWIRKAGAEHYGEHLDRLRAWVAELIELRTRPPADERDP